MIRDGPWSVCVSSAKGAMIRHGSFLSCLLLSLLPKFGRNKVRKWFLCLKELSGKGFFIVFAPQEAV